jgi:hypothetical protein
MAGEGDVGAVRVGRCTARGPRNARAGVSF